MTATACLPDLRTASLDDLAEIYRAAEAESDAWRAVLAECERRDRADQARRVRAERGRRRRASHVLAWRETVQADYLAADAECRGNLLSRAGIAAGISEETALWTGPERWARRMASEELNAWWDAHGRLTMTAYRRQMADAARIARDDADWAAWDAEIAAAPAAPQWESLPGGGRVRESCAVCNGRRHTAWWAITPAGKATLHPDRDAAVAAATAGEPATTAAAAAAATRELARVPAQRPARAVQTPRQPPACPRPPAARVAVLRPAARALARLRKTTASSNPKGISR